MGHSRTTSRAWRPFLRLTLALALCAGFVRAGDWGRMAAIHVKETQVSGLGTTIRVPLAVVRVALRAVRNAYIYDGVIPLKTGGMPIDLGAAWREIRKVGNIGPIPFEKDGQSYAVSIRAGRLVVSVSPLGRPAETVTIQIVLPLMDVILHEGARQIDLVRVFEATRALPPGFLLEVRHPAFSIEVDLEDFGF